MEISSLSDAELKTLVIRMPKEFSEDLNIIKKIQSEMKNTGLAGVAQWIENHPVNQKVAGSIPSQGTCLGCRPGPQ